MQQHDLNAALPPLGISIVTRRSSNDIGGCLSSVFSQIGFTPGKNLFVCVADNSPDESCLPVLQAEFGEHFTSGALNFIQNHGNLGFARGQNTALSRVLDQGAEYVLILNPDLRLAPDALQKMLQVLVADARAGMVTPKLLRTDEQLNKLEPSVIDAAGMYFTPSLRHFDRGADELDTQKFERECYVFGGTGAALMVKKECVFDLAEGRDGSDNRWLLLDELFFVYREDADFAWRAQRQGWKCRYVPQSICYHRRMVTPERRSSLPQLFNALGVQNRFLMQFKNFSLAANWHCVLPGLFRNLLVIVAVFTKERSSLPALKSAWALRSTVLRKRTQTFARARVKPAYLAWWFSNTPRTEPCLGLAVPPQTPVSSVLAVVVNYSSGTRLRSCLESLNILGAQLPPNLKFQVAVVDNSPQTESARALAAQFSENGRFNFIFPGENLGFSAAINRAVANSTGNADSILILNPDVQCSARALELLIGTLNRRADIGLVAPLLEGLDGKIQRGYSMRRLPDLGAAIAELLLMHRWWPSNQWTARLMYQDDPLLENYLAGIKTVPGEDPREPLLVEQPAFACVLIRQAVFKQLGGMDERFYPAWFEDVDFCKRLSQNNLNAAVIQEARVLHEGGYSFVELTPNETLRPFYRNQLLYFQKHFSVQQFVIFRIAFAFALFLRGVASIFIAAYCRLFRRSEADQHYKRALVFFKLSIGL